MIRHLTYTDHNMTISAELARTSALKHGCQQSIIFRSQDIDKDFAKQYESTLSQPRGAGYWLWKPQVIKQMLDASNEGDWIVYTDAGVEMINSIENLLIDDIVLFNNQWMHRHWCKRDCFSEANYDRLQLQASVIILRKCERSVRFVQEWLDFCTTPHCIDDSPSLKTNYPDFQEHRHDQALLTETAYKWGIKPHWWCANYGQFNYPKNGHSDTYPITFYHHRRRNNEY